MTGKSQGRVPPPIRVRPPFGALFREVIRPPRMLQSLCVSSYISTTASCQLAATRTRRSRRVVQHWCRGGGSRPAQRPCTRRVARSVGSWHVASFARQDVHTTPLPLPARASVIFDPTKFGGRVSADVGRTATNLDEPRRTSTNLDEPRRTSTDRGSIAMRCDAMRCDATRCDATADRSRWI